MNKFILYWTIFVISIAITNLAEASTQITDSLMNNTQLISLYSGKNEVLLQNTNVATAVLVFQPNCPWCKKQRVLFKKIKQQCGGRINLVLVGYHGNTQALKRELRFFDDTIPAYKANKSFLRLVKGIDASPTILLLNKKGELLLKNRGYMQPKKLMNAISILTKQQCSW